MATSVVWRGTGIAVRARRSLGRRYASTSVLDTLSQRGLLYQVTAPNSLRAHLQAPRSVYVGVDPSADSLHVGNLLPLLAALHFVRHGHKAVILIGGATGSIGDPSGRDTERQALSPSELQHNITCITEQVHDFFAKVSAYDERQGADLTSSSSLNTNIAVVNNADWYKDLNVLHFLRDVGRHARVNTMMARDSVKSRLQPGQDGQAAAGLSFTEFSYQLLQAYDFRVLHGQPWACTVQLGGSDQMGNIMAGVDLIRRTLGGGSADAAAVEDKAQPAYGLTLPLLTTSSGAKFGKSAGNAVWLDAAQCSHFDFFQYFYRARDADVSLYLRTLTLLPLEEINAIIQQHEQQPSQRYAQRRLASHITELVRGRQALQKAEVATRVLFETQPDGLTTEQVVDAFADDARLRTLPRGEVIGKEPARLVAQLGLTRSYSEARRTVTSGGLYVNNIAIRDPALTLTEGHVIPDTDIIILRLGKTQHVIVRLTS